MARQTAPSARLLAALALVLLPSLAFSGGFALSEQGARATGLGGAFVGEANDPSAIFFNAAGIAFLRGSQLQAGGALVRPRTTFTGADPAPGSDVVERTDGAALFPPSLYYTHQFSERLVLGAGLTRPFGTRPQWESPDAFSGRFLAQRVDLSSYAFSPTAAFRLADRLAIGAGLDVHVGSLSARRRIPGVHPTTHQLVDAGSIRIDGDRDTALGFHVGALARPMENLSVGLQYRSRIRHDFHGTAEFSLIPTGVPALDAAVAAVIPAGSLPVRTPISLPASITGGAAYRWDDWTFAGQVDFVQWSRLRQVAFDYEGREDLREVFVEDYADSLTLRAGVERRFGSAWAARAGYFFDDSPAPAESQTPLLFDADKQGLVVGGSWKYRAWRIDAAAGLTRTPRRPTGATAEGFDGAYRTRAVTAGLSFNYAF
jgi:long-chain fatty acid transport protein